MSKSKMESEQEAKEIIDLPLVVKACLAQGTPTLGTRFRVPVGYKILSFTYDKETFFHSRDYRPSIRT